MPTDGFVYFLCSYQSAIFWRLGTQRSYDPEIRTRPRFFTVHLHTKFHHFMLNRSEVIVLTNKQTNKHIHKQVHAAGNIHLAFLCYADGEKTFIFFAYSAILSADFHAHFVDKHYITTDGNK